MSNTTSIKCVREGVSIAGKPYVTVEVWEVPEDFTSEEAKLLEEICFNNVLTPSDAFACVRALR
jgi:hypothetical protein